MTRPLALLLCAASLSACATPAVAQLAPGTLVKIEWGDADSGKATEVDSGETYPFRVKDWDAGGTVPVSWKRETKCAAERLKGYAALRFMRSLTDGKPVEIAENYGLDRTGKRFAVDLLLGSSDIALIAADAGHYQYWPHVDNVPMTDKPDWCDL